MKRFLAILLVFIMMFSFAACGGGDADLEADGDQIKNEQQDNENKDDNNQDADADDAGKDDKGSEADKKEDKPAASQPSSGENGVQKPSSGNESSDKESQDTVGQILLKDFNSRVSSTATTQSIADGLISNSIIEFFGGTSSMEVGAWLPGLGDGLTGYKECTTFGPMMTSIAFVGYIFELEDGVDADEFEKTLADNANPRWNICVTADETTIDTNGRFVFFLMAPMHFEDAQDEEL